MKRLVQSNECWFEKITPTVAKRATSRAGIRGHTERSDMFVKAFRSRQNAFQIRHISREVNHASTKITILIQHDAGVAKDSDRLNLCIS